MPVVVKGRGRCNGWGAVAAVGLLLSSCTSGPAGPSLLPSATRADPGPLRTDEAPLTRRFPALGDPVTVTWRSGTTGDGAAPGPSTYWIDAVVRLPPGTADELAAAAGVSPTVAATGAATGDATAELPADLPADVRAAAGNGPWRTAATLDAAFSTSGFGTQVFLSGDVVVLRAIGSGEPG